MPSWTNRILGLVLAIVICCSPALLSAAAQQTTTDQSQSQPSAPNASPAQETPQADQAPGTPAGAAGAENSNLDQVLPDAPSANVPAASEPNQNAGQNSTQNDSASNQQSPEPAGTAAAQIGKLKGGPASKPAGAAIAPAKQHRVRSYLLKFGALAGAGVAVGTVYALSHGSPSRPPGAH